MGEVSNNISFPSPKKEPGNEVEVNVTFAPVNSGLHRCTFFD